MCKSEVTIITLTLLSIALRHYISYAFRPRPAKFELIHFQDTNEYREMIPVN